jgi:transcriptional accessory protein Tex/SPT6
MVSVGQTVAVRIDSIEPDRRRISLRLVPTAEEVAAAEKARAEREARIRRENGEPEESEEELIDIRAALDEFKREKSGGASFGSLDDAFSGLGI